ncbi:MAG: YbhB/YbcL family Raf kinase inhibitor-like protein [Methylovulum sp.]|nr:YbhB/YbcL family Raf kinase inhibitor-like protein [Methylovulum sp.]
MIQCAQAETNQTGTKSAMNLESSAFLHQGEIPDQYTCEGASLSPPLHWSQIPATSKSLVLIVDDPDAPDPAAPKLTWVHWLLYNLPVNGTGLPEAVKNLPTGTGQGLNDWQKTGYGGPCPPIGRHRYFHKLYALDVVLPASLGEPTKAELEQAMQGHIVAKTELIGTYQKKKSPFAPFF